MRRKVRLRFRKIKYLKEKQKLIKVGLILMFSLFVSFGLLSKAYSAYQSSVKLNANIDQALYIFGGEKMNFNIDTSKIVPSSSAYKYKFSVSNFDANKQSDINLEYTVDVKTTTNLPITLSLYKNGDTTNNLLSNISFVQDGDGSWYRVFETSNPCVMSYEEKVTDIYTLHILFPAEYAQNTVYSDLIENIEIMLKSKQVVD